MVQAFGHVTQIVPLHNRDELNPLKKKWYTSFEWKQPLGKLVYTLKKHRKRFGCSFELRLKIRAEL